MEELHGSFGTLQQHGAGGPSTIDVDTTIELIDALKPQNAGKTIRVMAGIYKVNKTLVVPNGATLQGAGVMLFDD
jgi:hypothetical protein